MADAIFKTQCQNLRKDGMTLGEIVVATKRPKTSVYFHIKNIPLGLEKRRKITQTSTKRILAVNRLRKGKSLRLFRKFYEWCPQTVALTAHLLFDGEIRYSGCIYHNRSRALIDSVELSFTKIYDYLPTYSINKDGVHRISYFNVALAKYMRTKSVELINRVTSLPTGLQREFLKSFFDDEGCVSFDIKRKKRRVRGYQHNEKTLIVIKQLLQKFCIDSKIQDSIEIVIGRKHNLERFAREINFSPGVCVNGNRTNSTWKESLEKREILRRALESYQK